MFTQSLRSLYAQITQSLRNHYAKITQFNYAALRNSLRNSLYAIPLRNYFTQLVYAEILIFTRMRNGKFYAEILEFTQWATC